VKIVVTEVHKFSDARSSCGIFRK